MVDDIICDIRMPKINILEAIAFFRQQYPSVPVLVLTGYPDIQLTTNLLKQGVVDYMVKDRKSTRLNSSHLVISYAVFCLKKKKNTTAHHINSTSRHVELR